MRQSYHTLALPSTHLLFGGAVEIRSTVIGCCFLCSDYVPIRSFSRLLVKYTSGSAGRVCVVLPCECLREGIQQDVRDRVAAAREEAKKRRVNAEMEGERFRKEARLKAEAKAKAMLEDAEKEALAEKERTLKETEERGKSLSEGKASEVGSVADLLFKLVKGEDIT